MVYRPISEYGAVGNDDRCALVDRDGSVDWLSFPQVAAPSVFARLLDAEDGGHFAVAPTGSYDSEQSYRERTNVLETRFETSRGTATLVDFMPTTTDGGDDQGDRDADRKRAEPPDYQRALYRRFSCEDGALTVEADFKPRFDYARTETAVERADGRVVATGDDERLTLQVGGPLELEPREGRAVGTATLEAGETVWFVLQYDHVTPRTPDDCRRIEAATTEYWRDWADGVASRAEEIVGDDPWLEEVVRSALVLKLLVNEGSGAIYAAPTTSLPEEYGDSRNWDYRYNWIRDAKFTVQALYNLGQEDAAREYFEWFREICHEDPEDIQPVYGVHGERELSEFELDNLAGYRFSAPVRVGNAAAEQRQLDVYGTIVQGLYETLLHDEHLTEEDWTSVRGLVDHVCDVWDERGAGIWEFRGEPRHYVHSKLMCWVAVDRGIELAGYHDEPIDTGRWEAEREAIREAIEERGYSEEAGSFVQHFETDETLDATCLLIPIFEFLPPDDDRVQSTIDTVREELMTDEGLVHRTRGEDVPGEGRGAFLFCSFWLVDALVLAGRIDEAREVFTNVLEHVESPPLLPERIAGRTGEYLGNYPQAFSHIGLINSAIYLGCAADRSMVHDPLAGDLDVEPLFRS